MDFIVDFRMIKFRTDYENVKEFRLTFPLTKRLYYAAYSKFLFFWRASQDASSEHTGNVRD